MGDPFPQSRGDNWVGPINYQASRPWQRAPGEDPRAADNPVIWNLAVKDCDDVFADRPIPLVGLDDDSLEQVVRDLRSSGP